MHRPPSSDSTPTIDPDAHVRTTITPVPWSDNLAHTGPANYPIRQHSRLPQYDYSHAGSYFVTIRSFSGRPVFGYVDDGLVRLSPLGFVVRRCWLDIPRHYGAVTTDQYVVMPNHVHGILLMDTSDRTDAASSRPTLSTIVGSFKSAVTREWHGATGETEAIWQRGYYEHVIRRNESLDRIRQYVVNNPVRWSLDTDNPDREGRR